MSNRSTTTAGAVCAFLCAIGVCHGAGHIYWGSHHGNGLKIAKDDGAKAVELVSASFVQDVAIAPSLDAIFWSEPFVGEIHRASLNGSNEQTIVSGLGMPWGLAVDTEMRNVYWSDFHSNKIQRANLDGTGQQDVLTDLAGPKEIEIDPAARNLYWVENGTGKIRTSDLRGSNAMDVVTGLPSGSYGVGGMALDLVRGRIYWAEGDQTHKVRAANLDGAGITTVIDATAIGGQPVSVAVDPYDGHLFWCNFTPNEIHRANLDGSEDIALIATGRPTGIIFLPLYLCLSVEDSESVGLSFVAQSQDNYRLQYRQDLTQPPDWDVLCTGIVVQTGSVSTNAPLA